MAARRKPKARKLKFELTRSAIAGVGVVAFCLFLWMFLLGIWVGQTLLLPTYEKKNVAAAIEKIKAVPQIIRADKKAVKKSD